MSTETSKRLVTLITTPKMIITLKKVYGNIRRSKITNGIWQG